MLPGHFIINLLNSIINSSSRLWLAYWNKQEKNNSYTHLVEKVVAIILTSLCLGFDGQWDECHGDRIRNHLHFLQIIQVLSSTCYSHKLRVLALCCHALQFLQSSIPVDLLAKTIHLLGPEPGFDNESNWADMKTWQIHCYSTLMAQIIQQIVSIGRFRSDSLWLPLLWYSPRLNLWLSAIAQGPYHSACSTI